MAAQLLNSKNLFKVLLLALAPLLVVSCSKDDKSPMAPEAANPAELMAGDYYCSFRLTGGQNWGGWGSRLIITSDSTVYFDAEKVLKPKFKSNALSWSTVDGNPHNADLKFYNEGADPEYWPGTPPTDYKNFSGVFSRLRDAQLDIRALEDIK